jgi:hypothetical protein
MLGRGEAVACTTIAFAILFQRPQAHVLTTAGGLPPDSVTPASNDMPDIDSNACSSRL